MNAETAPESPLLLATDLGGRCDRALERARLLAGQATAAVAATVVEPASRLAREVADLPVPGWYRAGPPALRAERALRRQLAGSERDWTLHVGEGDAGGFLTDLLAGMPGALVVTGPGRDGPFDGVLLGSTVDRLLRRAGTELLMVRERAYGPYRHLVVASDFSPAAVHALRAAVQRFPRARVTLLHAFSVPRLGLMDATRDEAVAQAGERAREEAKASLRGGGIDPLTVDLVIEHADPARLLQQYIETFEPDLAVVGTHGRGAAFDMIVGSVARRIVATAAIDLLLVRPA